MEIINITTLFKGQKKLCSRHKQDIINDSNKKNGLTCHAKLDSLVKLVDSSKCDLCKLESAFDKVLDKPQFRDLRP